MSVSVRMEQLGLARRRTSLLDDSSPAMYQYAVHVSTLNHGHRRFRAPRRRFGVQVSSHDLTILIRVNRDRLAHL